MAISIAGIGDGAPIPDTAATNLLVPFDAAASAGDVVVVLAATDNKAISTPSGWTPLASAIDGTCDTYAFGKEMAGGETGVTIACPVTFNRMSGRAIRLSGATLAGAVTPAGAFGNDASADCPAVTTPADGSLVLWLAGLYHNGTTLTAPAGADGSSTYIPAGFDATKLGIAYNLIPAAGVVAGKSWANTFTHWGALTIALAPAPAGPSVNLPAIMAHYRRMRSR